MSAKPTTLRLRDYRQFLAANEASITLIVIEAMKMEIAVQTVQPGTVAELCCQRGQPVSAGETLLILRTRGREPS
jgi:hypothetical protein